MPDMKFMAAAGVILFVLILLAWAVRTRNHLVTLKGRVKNQMAQVDVQLKRRYDLIPNLLETAKGYAVFERGTLEAVMKARQSAMAAADFEQAAQANQRLSTVLKQFLAVGEAYPDLKANGNFMQLQHELSETEDKIALSRQFYNDTVFKYNNAIELFPASLIAGICGFHTIAFWEAAEAERERIAIKAEDMKF